MNMTHKPAKHPLGTRDQGSGIRDSKKNLLSDPRSLIPDPLLKKFPLTASNRGLHQLLLLLVTLFAAFMATPCFATGTRDEVLLEGSSIHVGDIFLEPGDQAATVIAAAPEPGKSVVYDVSDLARIAKAVGINWKPSGNYDRVTLTRASEVSTAAMVRDLAVEQLRTEDMNADLDVALDNRNLEIHRPKGEPLNYRLVDFKHDAAGHRFSASLVVDNKEGAQADVIAITGRAMPMIKAAQLRHGVSTGDRVREEDIEWLRLPQDKSGGDAISLAQQLNGVEAIRNLGSGAILRLRDVRPARIVT